MHRLVRYKRERRYWRARGEDVSFSVVKIKIPDRKVIIIYIYLYIFLCIYIWILYVHFSYPYRAMVQNEIQFIRKIYLSLYSKWLRKSYVWEVSWRLNKAATYWPPALLAIAALLSRSAGLLNRGPRIPALCSELVLTPRTARTDSKLWSPTNLKFQ